MVSMKTFVVGKLREWYDIPEDTRGNHVAIINRVKYLLDNFRYIFENLSVHNPYFEDVMALSGFDFTS